MNKKGQTLVIFVIILPIIIMLFEIINLDVIHNTQLTEFIKANDKKIKINIKDNDIILKKEIGSVFGRIIGKTTYKIESWEKGKYYEQ